MTSAERLQKLHKAIVKCRRDFECVSLDISIDPPKEDEQTAVVTYRHFLKPRPGAAWGEPHVSTQHIIIQKDGSLYVRNFFPKLLPQDKGGIKEHVGVRERGYPKHSTL